MTTKPEVKNAFLPEGYKEPTSWEKFTKLALWETRLRILSNVTAWWSYFKDDWTKDVSKEEKKWVTDWKMDQFGNKSKPKHFWAVVVWNYAKECIQVWEITQKVIRNKIQALVSDPDRSDIHAYDLKITKAWEGKDTTYEVVTGKEVALSQTVRDMYFDSSVDLEKLFTNEDPFS